MKCDILMKIIEYKIKSDDNENGDLFKEYIKRRGLFRRTVQHIVGQDRQADIRKFNIFNKGEVSKSDRRAYAERVIAVNEEAR